VGEEKYEEERLLIVVIKFKKRITDTVTIPPPIFSSGRTSRLQKYKYEI
jgi:hypothetical protein